MIARKLREKGRASITGAPRGSSDGSWPRGQVLDPGCPLGSTTCLTRDQTLSTLALGAPPGADPVGSPNLEPSCLGSCCLSPPGVPCTDGPGAPHTAGFPLLTQPRSQTYPGWVGLMQHSAHSACRGSCSAMEAQGFLFLKSPSTFKSLLCSGETEVLKGFWIQKPESRIIPGRHHQSCEHRNKTYVDGREGNPMADPNWRLCPLFQGHACTGRQNCPGSPNGCSDRCVSEPHGRGCAVCVGIGGEHYSHGAGVTWEDAAQVMSGVP